MVATTLKSQTGAVQLGRDQAANQDVASQVVDTTLNTSLTERALSENHARNVGVTAERVSTDQNISLIDAAISPEARQYRDIEIYNERVVKNSGLKRALPLQEGSFVTVSNDRHSGAERGDTLRLWVAA